MAPKPKPRVFLDSNVIISGLYSPQGAPGKIMESFIRGNLNILVSQQVIEEVIRTVKEKLPEALPALRKLLVTMPPEVVADPKPEEILPWTKRLHYADAAILASAIAAHPDHLVTGDNHFLEDPDIAKESGLSIITPSQLLDKLG